MRQVVRSSGRGFEVLSDDLQVLLGLLLILLVVVIRVFVVL